MKKSARVSEKLVSPGLPGLQVATLVMVDLILIQYWTVKLIVSGGNAGFKNKFKPSGSVGFSPWWSISFDIQHRTAEAHCFSSWRQHNWVRSFTEKKEGNVPWITPFSKSRYMYSVEIQNLNTNTNLAGLLVFVYGFGRTLTNTFCEY